MYVADGGRYDHEPPRLDVGPHKTQGACREARPLIFVQSAD
jgi:hypothetical protein